MVDSTSILKLFLPSWLFDFFDVVEFSDSETRIDVYLDEKKIPPSAYANELLGCEGFTSSYTVQDFPARGKEVYLHLRRRKWLIIKTGKIVSNSFEFAYQGTRLTQEFVAFLKETNRE